MRELLNEKVVMQYYLDEMAQGKVDFLEHKREKKEKVEKLLREMLVASAMNAKIQIANQLWKVLFEASMSYIDREKQGYSDLFHYFDEYVEFEELIFASDSFYRDHTLHCLWVYFLGEYIHRNEEYSALFLDEQSDARLMSTIKEIFVKIGITQEGRVKSFIQTISLINAINGYNESFRCVAALTHDLGYPLKKIDKINKSIQKVMPYYSINNYENFQFQYSNLQQHVIECFLDLLSMDFETKLVVGEHMEFLMTDMFEFDKEILVGLKEDALDHITPEQIELLRTKLGCKVITTRNLAQKIAYANDMEEYQHGIMSAYLLMKNLKAFQDMDANVEVDTKLDTDFNSVVRWEVKQEILTSISNHTSSNYRIQKLDRNSYLTFIDELEEFSRLSRASQSREYVQEFCESRIYLDGEWLNIEFTFENSQLDNLDPERAFKGRCKRFLTLFDIWHLSDHLKIRLSCIGNIPNNKNHYTLEIAQKYADILINGESQCIPKYLKSEEFYTKEEYMQK